MQTCEVCSEPMTGDACACGWSLPLPSTVHARSTYREMPVGLTKEEFGMTLYKTIELIGGILQLRQWRAARISAQRAKPGDLKKWQVKEKDLSQKLRIMMVDQLSAEEAAEVAMKYPWVASHI